jgi:hypothetical protein
MWIHDDDPFPKRLGRAREINGQTRDRTFQKSSRESPAFTRLQNFKQQKLRKLYILLYVFEHFIDGPKILLDG